MITFRKPLWPVVLLSVLLMGLSASKAHSVDYFPLKVWNCWVYYPSYGDGYRIDNVIGTEKIGGKKTYILKRLEAPPDNYHEKVWLVNNGTFLKAFKFWSTEITSPSTEAVLFAPPLIFQKFNPKPKTWQIESDMGAYHAKKTFWIESGTATVTVPAGTFNNCIMVRSLEEISTSTSTEYKYKRQWLAPDVGPVLYNSYTANWTTATISQMLVAYSLE